MRIKHLFHLSFLLWVACWAAFPASAAAGDATITAEPHNPPVVIQPEGGGFDVTLTVDNTGSLNESFDVWTSATLPDGTVEGPLFGPVAFDLPPGWAASRTISESVGGAMPPGIYTYTAHVGIYPDGVDHADSFTFEKLDTQSGWYAQTSGDSDFLTAVYFVDADFGWAAGSRNTILHTADGGDNWYAQDPPPSTNYRDIHFADRSTGWAVGSSGRISATADGGTTWAAQDSGTSYDLNGLHFIDNQTGWAVGGKNRTFTAPHRFVLFTKDGGKNWKRLYRESNRDPFSDVFFIDEKNGWAVGARGDALYTNDGGKSWTPGATGINTQLYAVFFADAFTGWAVGSGGVVIRTLDGGATWYPQSSGVSVGLSDVHFADPFTGWIVGGDGNGGVVLATTDGGATWYPQDPATSDYLGGIFFIDGRTGWAVGLGGAIIHTESGGE